MIHGLDFKILQCVQVVYLSLPFSNPLNQHFNNFSRVTKWGVGIPMGISLKGVGKCFLFNNGWKGAGTKGIGIIISIFQLQVLTILDCRVARSSQRSIIPSLCLWAEPRQVIPDWWDATSFRMAAHLRLPTKCADWNS